MELKDSEEIFREDMLLMRAQSSDARLPQNHGGTGTRASAVRSRSPGMDAAGRRLFQVRVLFLDRKAQISSAWVWGGMGWSAAFLLANSVLTGDPTAP